MKISTHLEKVRGMMLYLSNAPLSLSSLVLPKHCLKTMNCVHILLDDNEESSHDGSPVRRRLSPMKPAGVIPLRKNLATSGK